MAESTKTQTEEVEDNEVVVRFIDNEEEIWDVDETDENDVKRGKMLTLEEQLGVIEFELSKPMKLSDQEESVTSIKLKAPSMDDIDSSKNRPRAILQKCVIGINPRDLKLEGRDYLRLQRLLRHFLQ